MKRHYKHIISAGFLLAGVAVGGFLLVPSRPSHAAATQFSLSPSSQSVAAGSTFTVTVELATGGNAVDTVQAGLSYPASQLSCVGTASTSDFTIAPQADTCSGGNVLIQRGRTGSFTNDAAVATVTFKALTAGTTPAVSFTGSTVAYSGGSVVASSTTGGSYTVPAAAPAPSPSPSPSPATSSPATSSGSSASGHSTSSGSTGSSKSGTGATPSSGTGSSAGSSTASGGSAAPTISHVQVGNISATSATVSWSTDQPATSVVGYGLNESYQLSAVGNGLSTQHSVALNPAYLARGLTYHVRVTSANAAGAVATSATSFVAGGFTVNLHITDKAGHNLPSASVKLAGQSHTTNSQGDTSFTNVPSGTQTVSVSYQGVSTKSKITVGKPGANGQIPADQSFTLTAATFSLASLGIAVVILILLLFAGWEAWQWRTWLGGLWHRQPPASAPTAGDVVGVAGGVPNPPAEATSTPPAIPPAAPDSESPPGFLPHSSSTPPLPGMQFRPSAPAEPNDQDTE